MDIRKKADDALAKKMKWRRAHVQKPTLLGVRDLLIHAAQGVLPSNVRAWVAVWMV